MAVRKFLALALVLLQLAGSARAANLIPGRWEKVDLLISGTPILVKMNTDEQVQCILISSDRDTLLVVVTGIDQRRIRKASVESIIALKYDDPLKNGAIIGLASGAAAGTLFAVWSTKSAKKNRLTSGLISGAIFGLVGMGIGLIIDYRHQGSELIYEARHPPAPIVK